ncbi:MAG: hypothetical protein LBL13_02100 [Bacteroidales bacterium]|jgi:hypothetical protein|nr:hypothetical protein [Bacteroidales bacterium]
MADEYYYGTDGGERNDRKLSERSVEVDGSSGFMIDTVNGGLHLVDKNFTVCSNLTKQEFISSSLYGDVEREHRNDSNDETYVRYYLKPQRIGENRFVLTLIFEPSGMICMALLHMLIDDIPLSWDEWSEAKELERKMKHDELLKNAIGNPPYKYSWGLISSNYDPRSGSSNIALNYRLP